MAHQLITTSDQLGDPIIWIPGPLTEEGMPARRFSPDLLQSIIADVELDRDEDGNIMFDEHGYATQTTAKCHDRMVTSRCCKVF